MRKTKAGKKAPRVKAPRVRMKEEAMLDVRHDFTQDEKIDLGQRLTAHMTTYQQVEAQKKTTVKEFDSKLKTFQTTIDEIHGKLRDGHEYRPTPVIVHFNKGTKNGKAVSMKGQKRICRKDNGEHIRDEPMTQVDLQTELLDKKRIEDESKRVKDEAKRKAAEEKKNGTDLPLNAPVVPEQPGGSASTSATA